MCGIVGIVGPAANLPENKQVVKKMMSTLAYRGPDGEGFVEGEGYLLGHRRLAIIDRDHGKQPMLSDDGKTILIFNGEIYNYLELRQELIRDGVRFKTSSDTEVLLRLYEKYKSDAVLKLNGMFSFAVVDEKTSNFFAARDQFGIKPFYYYVLRDGSIIFASEIKAILCHPEVKRSLNYEALQEYLTFQFCLSDKTLFEGVKKLLPAHHLNYPIKSKNININKYWTISYEIDAHHTSDYFYHRLNHLIQDSVSSQLRSDVPIGAHLSGGLDSSIIVASASTQYSQQLKCFTGKFDEGRSYDESEYARIMAKEFGCEYHEVTPNSMDFMESIRGLIYHMDEPAAGPGLFPQFIVSRLAKSHVSVVLGGQGGDEFFGGYMRYLVAYLEQCLKGAIYETQEEGSHIVTLDSIIPNLPALKGYVPMMQQFWSSGVFDSMEDRYFKLLDRSHKIRGLLSEDLTKKFDPEAIRSEFYDVFNSVESKSYLNKMTNFDQNTLLPALLQVEDRVSMSVSLESRVPLIDVRIAELVASMPPSMKFAGGQSKYALKQAMRPILPKEIIERKDKMGFPVPMSEWLKGPLNEFVSDILLGKTCRERGIFDVKNLKKLIGNEAQFSREVWGALCLELWFQCFFDGEEFPALGMG